MKKLLFILLLLLSPSIQSAVVGCDDITGAITLGNENYVLGTNLTSATTGTLDSLVFYLQGTNVVCTTMFVCYEIISTDTTAIDSTGVVTFTGDNSGHFYQFAVKNNATITSGNEYYIMAHSFSSALYVINAHYSNTGTCTESNSAWHGSVTWDGDPPTNVELAGLAELGSGYHTIGYMVVIDLITPTTKKKYHKINMGGGKF